jgi:hypothetical protein
MTLRDDPRFRRCCEQLHALGPRATYELALELAGELSATATMIAKVTRYAALDPASVRAVGADKLPLTPLTPIPQAAESDEDTE